MPRPRKKVHWTQTPEGRAKMSRAQRRAARKRRAATMKKPSPHETHDDQEIDGETFAYALGYTEAWLRAFAESAGVSATALAAQLGKVLSSKSGR